MGESAAARLGDEHHILYPDSEEAGQVDAGLCGDKMSGGEKLVLLRVGRDARLLVNLHAYAVTRAVAEEFAVARLSYDITRALSASKQETPGAIFSIEASCASSTVL